MIELVALAYAAAVTCLAPAILTRAAWPVWRPRTALLAWYAAVGSSLVAVVIAVGHFLDHLADLEPGHTGSASVELLATWLVLLMSGCLLARVLARVDRVARRGSIAREDLAEALACPTCSRERLEEIDVHVVASSETFALSCRAPERTIVLSSSLRARLSDLEARSVVEHEQAHLGQRHHLAVWLASTQSAMLPWFAPARDLERATRLLVELIADDAAARACGPAAVVGALTKLDPLDDGDVLQLRATRLLTRWTPDGIQLV